MDTFESLTSKQLQALCKEKKLTGFWKLKKVDLIRVLTESSNQAKTVPPDPLTFARMLHTIPDIDDQVAAITQFAEGKISYAQMRALSG